MSTITTIGKGALSASISSKGAELQSLKLNGVEYLWQADPALWGKHAPVLFPIVGSIRNGPGLIPPRAPAQWTATVSRASTSMSW